VCNDDATTFSALTFETMAKKYIKELKEIKRHNTQKKNKKNQRPLLNLRSYYERYVPEDIPFSVFERKVTEIEARSTQTCA